MNKRIRLLIGIVLVIVVFSACSKKTEEVSEKETSTAAETEAKTEESSEVVIDEQDSTETYTLMLYMVGSNLESDSQCASRDIAEMFNSGLDVENVNVVLCTGGSNQWHIGLPNNETCITQLVEDNGSLTLERVGSFGENVNMGDAENFSEFLNYVYDNYKTDHYALICWNHGGGPVGGFGNDELFGYDSLSYDEMKEAMSDTPFQGDHKLDWIGFDACLMASIEIANLFSEHAEYLIASEELEPGAGWDYSFLSVFNDSYDPEIIAKRIIDSYEEYYEWLAAEYSFKQDITLSCMKLSEIDQVTDAMDTLFALMNQELKEGAYQSLAKLRADTKTFAKGSGVDLVDLGHMAFLVSDKYQKESQNLLEALNEFIIYQISNIASTYGVSVYYPYESEDMYNSYLSELGEESNMQVSSGYDSYLSGFADIWLNGEPEYYSAEESFSLSDSANISIPDPEQQPESEHQLVVQLTENQMNELSAAYYTILCDYGDGTYVPALANCRVIPDQNGFLRIDLDQELIVATAKGTTNDQFMMFKEVEQREDGVLYQSMNTTVSGPFGVFGYTDAQPVVVKIFENEQNQLYVNTIDYLLEEGSPIGKQTVNLDHWDTLSYIFSGYTPKYDEQGNLLPYYEWIKDNGIYAKEIMLDDLVFEKRKVSEFSNHFVCQVVLEDIYGNSYTTNIENMYTGTKPEQYEETVSDGKYTWEIYSDHAKLISYEGTAAALVVPDTVNNLPVTEIGGNAFNGNNITSITLPDSVTSLDSYAFASCNILETVDLSNGISVLPEGAFSRCTALVNIELPDSITYISRFAFQDCSSLRHLEIPANVETILPGAFFGCEYLTDLCVNASNTSYTVVDGVLFTKDMKQLVVSPSLFKQSYVVPDGVEEICDYAFADAYKEKISGNQVIGYGLVEITLPDSLKVIGDGAFLMCCRFKNLEIPENVITIGSLAFGDYSLFEHIGDVKPENTYIEKIYIGENVSWIGDKAFAAYEVGNFEVSDKNSYFSADGNVLKNKQGTHEIDVFY